MGLALTFFSQHSQAIVLNSANCVCNLHPMFCSQLSKGSQIEFSVSCVDVGISFPCNETLSVAELGSFL